MSDGSTHISYAWHKNKQTYQGNTGSNNRYYSAAECLVRQLEPYRQVENYSIEHICHQHTRYYHKTFMIVTAVSPDKIFEYVDIQHHTKKDKQTKHHKICHHPCIQFRSFFVVDQIS